MVVDKIEHASLYYGLGKRFQTALEWLASADVGALTPGGCGLCPARRGASHAERVRPKGRHSVLYGRVGHAHHPAGYLLHRLAPGPPRPPCGAGTAWAGAAPGGKGKIKIKRSVRRKNCLSAATRFQNPPHRPRSGRCGRVPFFSPCIECDEGGWWEPPPPFPLQFM